MVALTAEAGWAAISEDRVLILVNNASSSSQYVAAKYCQYHPGIPSENVVYLSGLADITSSTGEMISRADFETFIAQPLRQYLRDHNLVDHIWVIITTAGLPYRIKDTVYTDVVYAHGSNATTVLNHITEIDAASVESELAVLWQIDPALDPNHRAPLASRIVNPYHGYISPMSEFCTDRQILSRREAFKFGCPTADWSRVYEGQQFNTYRATGGRQFCVKDMYLVARLDGPRAASLLPDMYISRMLESASRVSDPNNPKFHGFDPVWSAVIIDDKATGSVSDNDIWYNAGAAIGRDTPPEQYLTAQTYPTPPNVTSSGTSRDDYRYAYRSLVSSPNDTIPLPDPNVGIVAEAMGSGRLLGPVLYDPTNLLVSQAIDPNYGVVALCSFGIHQSGVIANYLLSGGPNSVQLFRPVYGAIFNSTESYNAVTFFTDANIPTYSLQGKIWQWIYIGGSGALGHVFEPLSNSVPDNDLLFFNYFRDADHDGVGDMTFIEAAYSSIPYLSWTTVVVGDPLMRIHRVLGSGPGWDPPTTCGQGAGAGTLLSGIGLLGTCLFLRKLNRRVS